jgi:hypothetical protein
VNLDTDALYDSWNFSLADDNAVIGDHLLGTVRVKAPLSLFLHCRSRMRSLFRKKANVACA